MRTPEPVDALGSLRARLRDLRAAGTVDFYERVDLATWTALRVGGLAELLVRCRTIEGACEVLDLLSSHGLRWLAMGSGSRLVPSDQVLRVPVLTLGGGLADWRLDGEMVVAGGGTGLAQLARSIASAGLSGSPRLFGTTGSVGGAVEEALGLGATELGVGEWVEVVRPGRAPERWRELGAGGLESLHRTVVTQVRVKLSEPPTPVVPPAHVAVRAVAPAFVATAGRPVAELLAAAGCAGLYVGGARMDPADPNCLRTTRSASARDVRTLVAEVRERVQSRTGAQLRSRLRFVDEWGTDLRW